MQTSPRSESESLDLFGHQMSWARGQIVKMKEGYADPFEFASNVQMLAFNLDGVATAFRQNIKKQSRHRRSVELPYLEDFQYSMPHPQTRWTIPEDIRRIDLNRRRLLKVLSMWETRAELALGQTDLVFAREFSLLLNDESLAAANRLAEVQKSILQVQVT